MRRMRVVAVAAVMAAAALAYSLPRVRAQNSSTSNAVGATVATGATSPAVASNLPIVIAQGISVRALALGATAGDAAASAEASQQIPPIYFTATQMPNRVMSLPASGSVRANAASVAGGAGASANLVAIAGTGTAGSLGDGGAAAAAQLSLKFDSMYMRSGVAVAPDGTIFIADTENATIRRISSASSSEPGVIRSVAGKWGPTQNVQLSEPMGLALDRAGNLYIADHGANAVIELHDAIASMPGKLEMLAQVAKAASVAVSSDGSRVYVAAPESNSVFTVDVLTRSMRQRWGTNNSAASPVLVQYHPCGTIDKGAQPCPSGIAADGGGNLFVSDPTGNKIIRMDAESGSVTTAASAISMPGEIAFDADGNLFIAEQGRNRISEIKGLGQPVASVTLTPPPPPVPPMGVPCPIIAPPPGFAGNTNFCAEPLAGITPTAAFTLTNNSNAALTGIATTTIGLAPADFVASSTSCTSTLNAGSSCLINVGFAPTATGTRTATLVVNYTGAANPLASSLAGTGDTYQITLASGQLTQISITPGATGTFMLQVVPDNIFTGTVTPICPGNLPLQTTCTFSPTSVPVTTPGTAVPFSVMFKTTSTVPVPPPKTGAAPMRGDSGGKFIALGAVGAFMLIAAIALCCFALFSSTGIPVYPENRRACAASGYVLGVEKRGNKRTRWLGLQVWHERRRGSKLPKRLVPVACAIALALCAAAILEGCSSGSGSSGGITGTPAGMYRMTVQATAQSAPRGVTVTLDVE